PAAERSGRSPVGGGARLAALAAGLRRRRSLRRLSFGALLAPLGRAPAGTVPAAVDAHALDPARIGVEHLDLKAARAGHEFPAHRHPPDPRHQIAAQGVDVLGGFADVELGADRRRHVVEARARIGEVRTVVLAYHADRGVLVMLVFDVADDLLDDVLDRDE